MSTHGCDDETRAIIAGMMSVEKFNEEQRRLRPMKPIHRPSLGPYTEANPKRCEKCGKLGPFDLSEECTAAATKETP